MTKTKRRLALVLDQDRAAARWLARGFELVLVGRGRFLAAELAAAAPELIVMESVHPSEAGWLLSWLRAQPRLAKLPVVMIVPFGPAPRRARGVAFIHAPLSEETLVAEIERLLDAAGG